MRIVQWCLSHSIAFTMTCTLNQPVHTHAQLRPPSPPPQMSSLNSVTKIFVITVKGLKPATWDQNAPTAPATHMWETGSLNWAQFMFQWFIRFPEFTEFLLHLGKTLMGRGQIQMLQLTLFGLSPNSICLKSDQFEPVQTYLSTDFNCILKRVQSTWKASKICPSLFPISGNLFPLQ